MKCFRQRHGQSAVWKIDRRTGAGDPVASPVSADVPRSPPRQEDVVVGAARRAVVIGVGGRRISQTVAVQGQEIDGRLRSRHRLARRCRRRQTTDQNSQRSRSYHSNGIVHLSIYRFVEAFINRRRLVCYS